MGGGGVSIIGGGGVQEMYKKGLDGTGVHVLYCIYIVYYVHNTVD